MNQIDTYLKFIEKTQYKYNTVLEFEKELYQKYGTGIVLPLWYILNKMEKEQLVSFNSVNIIDYTQGLFFIKKDNNRYICKISGDLNLNDENFDNLRMKIQKIDEIALEQAITDNMYIYKNNYIEQNYVNSINSGNCINGFCFYGYKGDIPFDGPELIEIAHECYQHIEDSEKKEIQYIVNLLIEKTEKSNLYEHCPLLDNVFNNSNGIPGEFELSLIHKIRYKALESLINDIWIGYDYLKTISNSQKDGFDIYKEDNLLYIETQNFQVIFDMEKEELKTSKISITDHIELSDHINIKRNQMPDNIKLETISRFQYIYDMAGITELIKKQKIKKTHILSF